MSEECKQESSPVDRKVMVKKAPNPSKVDPRSCENFETVYREPEVLEAPPASKAEAEKKKKTVARGCSCGNCTIM